MTTQVRSVDVLTVKQWLDRDQAVLVDVREPMEYNREHIIGSRLVPLSGFDPADFERDSGKPVVCVCRSGTRAARAAGQVLATGFDQVYALEGGIDGWKQAGLPVHFDRKAPLDLMRQVQIAAGSLVLLGVLLAVLVSPWFMALSGFVGAGLVLAGVTGVCGMARLLTLMPWNRPQVAAPTSNRPLTS